MNLLRVTDVQWGELEQLVRMRHGKIQFFTHPFYYDLKDWINNETNDLIGLKEDYDFYKLRRDNFFKACLDKAPVVIAEQDKDYNLLENRLLGDCSIYAIRTGNDDNLPLAFDSKNALFKMTEGLRSIGVTHATVGGVAMVVQKFTDSDDDGVLKLKPEFLQELKEFLNTDKLSAERWVKYTAQGCAGLTALYLALSGIDVALSSISYPHNPWTVFKRDSIPN